MDVLHFLSNAFWFVARPGNLLLFALLIAALVLWCRPARSGRLFLTVICGILLLATLLPVANWVARPLEERFPLPDPLPERIDGIVVLGGLFNAPIADERGALAINESAERLLIPVALAFRFPEARIVITGRGENHQTLAEWLTTIGLGTDRVEFEPEARNTFENALLSHQKVQPSPDETWLLVTSAQHMPRAVGVFRKIGWSVIPYPVDYRTFDAGIFSRWPDVAANLSTIGDAMKEWIGLVAYYAMDRSDELFPGPIEP